MNKGEIIHGKECSNDPVSRVSWQGFHSVSGLPRAGKAAELQCRSAALYDVPRQRDKCLSEVQGAKEDSSGGEIKVHPCTSCRSTRSDPMRTGTAQQDDPPAPGMGQAAARSGRPRAGRQVGRPWRHDRRQGGDQGGSRQGCEPGPARPGRTDHLRNSAASCGRGIQMSDCIE